MQIENFIYNENNHILILEDGSKKTCKSINDAIRLVSYEFRSEIIDQMNYILELDPDSWEHVQLYHHIKHHFQAEDWIDSLYFILTNKISTYIKKSHPDYDLFLDHYRRALATFNHFVANKNKPLKIIEKRSKTTMQLSMFN